MNNELLRKLYMKSFVKHPDPDGWYEDISSFDADIFAELIIKECMHMVSRAFYRHGDSEHNRAINMAMDEIEKGWELDGKSSV